MRIFGNLTLLSAAGVFASLMAVSMPAPADAQSYGSIPGEGFNSNIYIDGRTPIDKATRDKVEAYEQSYRDKKRAEQEMQERMKNFFYGDLIRRGRSDGRF